MRGGPPSGLEDLERSRGDGHPVGETLQAATCRQGRTAAPCGAAAEVVAGPPYSSAVLDWIVGAAFVVAALREHARSRLAPRRRSAQAAQLR